MPRLAWEEPHGDAVMEAVPDGMQSSANVDVFLMAGIHTIPRSMSKIGDQLPADAPVSRFLVSMAMASNDIEHAAWNAAAANEADRPEFDYWVRLVMGHFIEAADALQRWRSYSPEVRTFVQTLPPDGKDALAEIQKALDRVGRKAVDHARNHTFHYPAPSGQHSSDEALKDALAATAMRPMELASVQDHPDRVRYVFADQIALVLAMGKHERDDVVVYGAQVRDLQRGATHFVNFVQRAMEQHGVSA